MKQNLRRFIGLFLAVVMLFNITAFTDTRAYAAVKPDKLNDAVGKFADAAVKFTQNFQQSTSAITSFCTRLGGLSSAAAGIVGILQMTSVIKDPTTEMLKEIISILHDMQKTLSEINNKLDDVLAKLDKIEIEQKMIDRATNARDMSKNWNDFNTHYTNPLNDKMGEYESYINQGIEAWWKQTSHESVRVLVTYASPTSVTQTYSTKSYSEGFPTKADNGEEVVVMWSIGVPAEYIPNTSAIRFDINTYREDFKKAMIEKFRAAARDGINEDGSANSKVEGGSAVMGNIDNPEFPGLLEQYADYVLNEVIYRIALDVMSENDMWVTKTINAYKNYCKEVKTLNSGINAFLNYMYLTHGFEGEIKEDINNFCDGMIFLAGYYGEFVLSCAGQDRLKSQAAIEEIQELFTDTVLTLGETKKNALTGHDNYCYITGTLVEFDTVTAKSTMRIKVDDDGYKDYEYRGWDISVPSIIDEVNMQVLYRQYLTVPSGAGNFMDYLNKGGVGVKVSGPSRLKNVIMTKYQGSDDFNLGNQLRMQADQFIKYGMYFYTGNWYSVDPLSFVDLGPQREAKYYRIHDWVLFDGFDFMYAIPYTKAWAGARAFYGESHKSWDYDTACAFHTEEVTYTHQGGGKEHVKKDVYWYTPTFEITLNILKSTPFHNMNGEDFYENPQNPFAAFDMISLTRGVSDNATPHYVYLSKDITEVELDGEFDDENDEYIFEYNGVPVEPKVLVVKASGDVVVPESGYDVSYLDNNEPGRAWVIVKGKGEYAGGISVGFTITESDSDSDDTPSIHRSSGGGCNAMVGIGVVLGLVFVMKKLRRR